ncbi:hypothetical protein ACRAWD_18380 [Caulobacter segnis]
MTYKPDNARPVIVGRPVLVVIDVQKGSFMDWPAPSACRCCRTASSACAASARWSTPPAPPTCWWCSSRKCTVRT